MADENYTTFSGNDENGDLTVVADKIDFDTMNRGIDACRYKSKGAGHFSGDFSIYQKHNITADTGAAAYVFLAGICDGAGNLGTTPKSLVSLRDTNANRPVIADVDDVGNVDMSAAGSTLSQSTDYWDDFERVTNTLSWHIYSDSIRSTLVQTVSGTIINTSYTYEYVYAMSSRDDSSGASVTGYVQNLNLNEAAPTGIPIFRRRIEMRKAA